MRARYYDYQTQQFLTHDPLAAPQALDQPYAYANRNPVNYIDPSGTNPEDDEFQQGGKAPIGASFVPGGGGGARAATAANEFAIWFSEIRAINPLIELDLIGVGRGRTAQWLTPKRVERDPNCVPCSIAGTGDAAHLGRYAASLTPAQPSMPFVGPHGNKSSEPEA